MPDPTLSDALKEAYASVKDGGLSYVTLEIRNPAFTQPIRVVNDRVPLNAKLEDDASLNGGEIVEFLAFSFDMKITDGDKMELTIDNVSQEVIENIELGNGQLDLTEITFRVYLPADATTHGPHNNPPVNLTLSTIDVDVLTIVAKANLFDFINQLFLSEVYDETNAPGLIAG